MSIKTDIPSQVKSKFYHGIHPKHNFQLRIMDVIVRTKKFATDSLFFLTSAHANVSGDMLNRCRMNAITGEFLFLSDDKSLSITQDGKHSFRFHSLNIIPKSPPKPKKILKSKLLLVILIFTGKKCLKTTFNYFDFLQF